MAARRSNRALSQRPVPQEMLDRIVAAADLAPTATNARQLGYTLVTDPVLLRRMSEYTLGVFGKLADRLSHPLVRPWLSRLLPDVYRYIPVSGNAPRICRGQRPYPAGCDGRVADPCAEREPVRAEDANLAYQNASLMAEALGVSQIYMGFVLTAVRQDKKRGSARCWGSPAAVSVPSWRSGCRSSATRIISTARLPLWNGDRLAGLPGAVPGKFQSLFRGLCFFASSVRLIRLLSMEPRPLAPLSFPGAFAAVAPPGCLIRLLPVETSLLPSCCRIVRPRLCPSTRMRSDSAGCRRDTKKRPLLCRGRFSFAARCQLPERPHSPGE